MLDILMQVIPPSCQTPPYPPTCIIQYLTTPYTLWFPVVVLAAIVVISVVAIIYMLSSVTGREGTRTWAKIKIYDILLSFMLIIAFIAISSFAFSFDFQSAFASAPVQGSATGFVPSACIGSSKGTDLFSLAICDMNHFNQNVISLNTMIYYIALRFSFVPKLSLDTSALIPIKDVGVAVNLEAPSAFSTFTGYALQLLYGAFVLSQVQLLLLGASLLLFSLFMSIGLIARMFEMTKSFGGAMIAFAVGLGVIYPLLVCFTYGYINVKMDTYAWTATIGELTTATLGLIGVFISFIFGSLGVPGFSQWIAGFITYLGMAFMGLTLIPFLNFIVIDVFISDFSKAIGEKMSFLHLLSRII